MDKKNIVPFFKYLTVAMIIITIITLVLFKFIDILPNEYYLILIIFLGLVTLGLSCLVLTRRGVKKRIVGTILSIIYIILLILVIIYELNTIGFLKRLGFKNFKTENYSVLVLKESKYKEIEDLENKDVGSMALSDEGIKKAKDKLLKKTDLDLREYDDISKLKNEFGSEDVDSMLIEDSVLAMLNENDEEFEDSYKVIYKFSVDVETEDITDSVDITKDSFNVYVSGIDTYGSVNSVSRSDVNMVLSINPKKHKIFITSIPRDYYVTLAGKNAKDKLTHAGIYGVETSVNTIEDLLNIDINYYVKVNFSSLINVVDNLGGVTVNSEYSFTSKDGYQFTKGSNTVNGEKALSFVRERKAFSAGDRIRVQNQAAMIEAIIDKAMSPSIITKYNSLLNTLGDSFVTNLETKSITNFIKLQIDDMPKWEFDNYSLDGSNAFDYTYSYGSVKSYVMEPDTDTVINAQNKIKEVLNN